jgi:hypothetical protein
MLSQCLQKPHALDSDHWPGCLEQGGPALRQPVREISRLCPGIQDSAVRLAASHGHTWLSLSIWRLATGTGKDNK